MAKYGPRKGSATLKSARLLTDVMDGRGLSIRQVAQRCGVSPSTVSRLCHGETDSLRVPAALDLECTVGVTPGLIFTYPAVAASARAA